MELIPVSRCRLFALLLIPTLAVAPSASAAQARKNPVTTEYHGHRVTDNYQWLENAADPAVRKWTDEQNRTSRSYLDKLPTRDALSYEFEKLYARVSADYSDLIVRSNLIFALKFKPPAQ